MSQMGGISYNYKAANAEFNHHISTRRSRVSSKTFPLAPSSWTPAAAMARSSLSFRTATGELHGSDLSPTGIEIARKTFPNINFFLADGQSLYSDFLTTVGPVDVVISTEVIEHVYDPRGFLRNCYDLLKPGGIIILTTPYHGYTSRIFSSLLPAKWTATLPSSGITATSNSGRAKR